MWKVVFFILCASYFTLGLHIRNKSVDYNFTLLSEMPSDDDEAAHVAWLKKVSIHFSEIFLIKLNESRTRNDTQFVPSTTETIAGTYNTTVPEYAPRFTHPTEMTKIHDVALGTPFKLSCEAEGNPYPNITWTKNGKPLGKPANKTVRRLGLKYVRWTLIYGVSELDDEGNYTCIVCNSNGCIDFTFSVYILDERENYRSFLYVEPSNITAAVGENTTFECWPEEDMRVDMQWLRVETPRHPLSGLLKAPNSNLIQDQHLQFESRGAGARKGNVLAIYNVTHADEGWYTCFSKRPLSWNAPSVYLKVVDEINGGQNSSCVCPHCNCCLDWSYTRDGHGLVYRDGCDGGQNPTPVPAAAD